MAGSIDITQLSAREITMLENMDDPQRRETIQCALLAHRRPDRIAVGDPAPDLRLENIDGSEAVHLCATREQPLVLFFGSYT